MCVECFLCFSKESKRNFPKQFITHLPVVLKRYFILFVRLKRYSPQVEVKSRKTKENGISHLLENGPQLSDERGSI